LVYDAVTQEKKEEAYKEKKKKMFLFISLVFSLSLSFFNCQKKKTRTIGREGEREGEKQKLSSPLETNQLDFFSHFFSSSLLYT
jgi:hypothetical protein